MACWCNGKCPHAPKAAELLKKGQTPRAHAALKQILTAAPLCVESNLMLAGILGRNNHAAAALIHVEAAAQKGEPARIEYERGAALRAAMRIEEAIPHFHKALELSPDNPNVAAGYIGALEIGGHNTEAETLAKAARDRWPDNGEIFRLSAILADAEGDTAAALAFLDGRTLTPPERLERGRYLEKLGRFDEAWADWMHAKAELRDKGHRYNAEGFAKNCARLAAIATPPRPFFTRRAPELKSDPAPIFVCGYPRSGTTLLETILSNHSAITAGDELSGLSDIIENFSNWVRVRVPYPEAMTATLLGENSLTPRLMRDFYMLQAQERIGFKQIPKSKKGKGKFFTDKMPLNELHLPLIRMLFPAAPVLRLRRHPLDVMVSCMSHWLIHGGFYASSLQACATHYRAADDLAEGYRKNFQAIDRPSFIDFDYDRFAANQEPAARASYLGEIFGRIGLELEPACLAPHKNPRHARTLSYRQVRQPINAKGVGRWKHFRDRLAPAIEILKPVLERGGYEF